MQVYPVNSSSYSQNIKPRTGKKIAVAASSYLAPGLGQGINNQWGKAALMAGATIATQIPALKATYKWINSDKLAIETLFSQKNINAFKIAGIGLLAMKVISMIDAFRHTKADVE